MPRRTVTYPVRDLPAHLRTRDVAATRRALDIVLGSLAVLAARMADVAFAPGTTKRGFARLDRAFRAGARNTARMRAELVARLVHNDRVARLHALLDDPEARAGSAEARGSVRR